MERLEASEGSFDMALGQIMTAALLATLAVAHSVLGETGFVRPLVAADWSIDEVPRWAADRLLRVAWHLTSVAWLALAVVAVDGSPLAAVAVAAVASGLLMLIALPGHGAWPAFLVAGLFGFGADGLLTDTVLALLAWSAVAVLIGLAGLHLYWAAGGRAGLSAAVPATPDGSPTFHPGPVATAAVAGLLLGFAGIIGVAVLTDQPWWIDAAVWAGVAVLAGRAIGDRRYAGFTKKERNTLFGQRDDRWYTPLAVLLAIAASAAVL